MADHSHHTATPDKGPAFTGLVVALIFLLVTVVTIVKLTNAHYAKEAGAHGAAAESTR